MKRYVVHMKDEGNGSYFLTEDKALFEQVEKAERKGDEELMDFINDNEGQFEVVYSLDGITVIRSIQGYFY